MAAKQVNKKPFNYFFALQCTLAVSTVALATTKIIMAFAAAKTVAALASVAAVALTAKLAMAGPAILALIFLPLLPVALVLLAIGGAYLIYRSRRGHHAPIGLGPTHHNFYIPPHYHPLQPAPVHHYHGFYANHDVHNNHHGHQAHHHGNHHGFYYR